MRVLFSLLLTACGAATVTPTTTTHYRVGDYVVYRYAGRLIGLEPMLLMEEVIAQDGDRLVIEDTLTRGHDTIRAWRQTVIDTEENRRTNHVEALCELHGETCTPLPNENNADLLRMYDGLYVQLDAAPTDVTESEASIDVGGTEMTCHLRQSSITRGGDALVMKEYDCPDFLWTHGSVQVETPEKRRVLYVTVQSFGSSR